MKRFISAILTTAILIGLFSAFGANNNTPLEIKNVTPANKATNVKINYMTITITFNKSIRQGANYSKIAVTSNKANVTVTRKIRDNKLILTKSSNWSYNASYLITIPDKAVKDTSGNNLARKYVFTFKTAGQVTELTPENIKRLKILSTFDGKLKNNPTVMENADYYVSPNGSDTNPGSFEKPFKNWDKVMDVVKPGDLVYLRGGTYSPSKRNKYSGYHMSGKNGLPGKSIRLWAYPGEIPILDCQSFNPVDGGVGVRFTCDYWHIKGIEIKNVRQAYESASNTSTFNVGLLIQNAKHNKFENIKVYRNEAVGCMVSSSSDDNLIINSDFFDNYDKYTVDSSGQAYHGGHADGIHVTVDKGTKNSFIGCRFYNNSDDGIDLWEDEGTAIIDNCWAFKNGYDDGDGSGFKLGRTNLPKENYAQRIITRNVAYGNKQHGFDQNNANVLMIFCNNTSYLNREMGFCISKYNLPNAFVNNVSYANGFAKDYFTAEAINASNTWNGHSVSNNDFLSIDPTGLKKQRKENGNLPDINFLVPAPNGKLKDKGTDVGLAFRGRSPDIGAFESK